MVVTRHQPKEEFTHRQERGKLVQNQLQISGNTCWDFPLLPMLTNRHIVGTTPVKFHNRSSIPHTRFEVHAPKTVKKTTGLTEKARGRGGVSNLACEKRLFPYRGHVECLDSRFCGIRTLVLAGGRTVGAPFKLSLWFLSLCLID